MAPPSKASESLSTIARRMLGTPAARELVPLLPTESFRWLEHDYPAPLARWNYHPELEIHLIRRSSGSYIIGDQIGPFGPGQVAIIGAGLPHDWMSDLVDGEVIDRRDVVIHFTDQWVLACAQLMPELIELTDLLRDARRGVIYAGITSARAAEQIEAIGAATGSERVARMLSLLATMSSAPKEDRRFVTSGIYAGTVDRLGKAAVDAGLAYILENLTEQIRMSEAARLAHMSEPTFSKSFKKASGLTFSDMVKRLRIANACRMLDQTDATVSSISAAVGYSNLSNFNRQFLDEVGYTPRQYRDLDSADKPHADVSSLEYRQP